MTSSHQDKHLNRSISILSHPFRTHSSGTARNKVRFSASRDILTFVVSHGYIQFSRLQETCNDLEVADLEATWSILEPWSMCCTRAARYLFSLVSTAGSWLALSSAGEIFTASLLQIKELYSYGFGLWDHNLYLWLMVVPQPDACWT